MTTKTETSAAPRSSGTEAAIQKPAVPAARGVLPRDSVRVVAQPAMIDCGADARGHALTVVPLMDGDRVAGLEVRCGCGAATLIECVYQEDGR